MKGVYQKTLVFFFYHMHFSVVFFLFHEFYYFKKVRIHRLFEFYIYLNNYVRWFSMKLKIIENFLTR